MRENPLPNFVCVGAQKSGTTTLHDVLSQHPDIFLPALKETKFFFQDALYEQGANYYSQKYYGSVTTEKAIGDVDPENMYFEEIPERIRSVLGEDVKIVFMLRNPADRAYSHYLMSARRGFDHMAFDEAVECEERRIAESREAKNQLSYIDRGRYADQVARYMKYFKKENMLFVIFEEDFIKNKQETIERLLAFLGVDPEVALNLDLQSNKSGHPRFPFIKNMLHRPNFVVRAARYLLPTKKIRKKIRGALFQFSEAHQVAVSKSKLTDDERSRLINAFFMEDINRLERLLERDLSCWYGRKSGVR